MYEKLPGKQMLEGVMADSTFITPTLRFFNSLTGNVQNYEEFTGSGYCGELNGYYFTLTNEALEILAGEEEG